MTMKRCNKKGPPTTKTGNHRAGLPFKHDPDKTIKV